MRKLIIIYAILYFPDQGYTSVIPRNSVIRYNYGVPYYNPDVGYSGNPQQYVYRIQRRDLSDNINLDTTTLNVLDNDSNLKLNSLPDMKQNFQTFESQMQPSEHSTQITESTLPSEKQSPGQQIQYNFGTLPQSESQFVQVNNQKPESQIIHRTETSLPTLNSVNESQNMESQPLLTQNPLQQIENSELVPQSQNMESQPLLTQNPLQQIENSELVPQSQNMESQPLLTQNPLLQIENSELVPQSQNMEYQLLKENHDESQQFIPLHSKHNSVPLKTQHSQSQQITEIQPPLLQTPQQEENEITKIQSQQLQSLSNSHNHELPLKNQQTQQEKQKGNYVPPLTIQSEQFSENQVLQPEEIIEYEYQYNPLKSESQDSKNEISPQLTQQFQPGYHMTQPQQLPESETYQEQQSQGLPDKFIEYKFEENQFLPSKTQSQLISNNQDPFLKTQQLQNQEQPRYLPQSQTSQSKSQQLADNLVLPMQTQQQPKEQTETLSPLGAQSQQHSNVQSIPSQQLEKKQQSKNPPLQMQQQTENSSISEIQSEQFPNNQAPFLQTQQLQNQQKPKYKQPENFSPSDIPFQQYSEDQVFPSQQLSGNNQQPQAPPNMTVAQPIPLGIQPKQSLKNKATLLEEQKLENYPPISQSPQLIPLQQSQQLGSQSPIVPRPQQLNLLQTPDENQSYLYQMQQLKPQQIENNQPTLYSQPVQPQVGNPQKFQRLPTSYELPQFQTISGNQNPQPQEQFLPYKQMERPLTPSPSQSSRLQPQYLSQISNQPTPFQSQDSTPHMQHSNSIVYEPVQQPSSQTPYQFSQTQVPSLPQNHKFNEIPQQPQSYSYAYNQNPDSHYPSQFSPEGHNPNMMYQYKNPNYFGYQQKQPTNYGYPSSNQSPPFVYNSNIPYIQPPLYNTQTGQYPIQTGSYNSLPVETEPHNSSQSGLYNPYMANAVSSNRPNTLYLPPTAIYENPEYSNLVPVNMGTQNNGKPSSNKLEQVNAVPASQQPALSSIFTPFTSLASNLINGAWFMLASITRIPLNFIQSIFQTVKQDLPNRQASDYKKLTTAVTQAMSNNARNQYSDRFAKRSPLTSVSSRSMNNYETNVNNYPTLSPDLVARIKQVIVENVPDNTTPQEISVLTPHILNIVYKYMVSGKNNNLFNIQ